MAHYKRDKKDKDGNRVYRMLTKPRLIQHKYFDPEKPEERENFFYSLLLLFVPFRDEGSLLLENETAEQAFNRLLPENEDCTAYHGRLKDMLKAEARVRSIEEKRRADAAVDQKEGDGEETDDGIDVQGRHGRSSGHGREPARCPHAGAA